MWYLDIVTGKTLTHKTIKLNNNKSQFRKSARDIRYKGETRSWPLRVVTLGSLRRKTVMNLRSSLAT